MSETRKKITDSDVVDVSPQPTDLIPIGRPGDARALRIPASSFVTAAQLVDYVLKTTTVNGHDLSGNVSVTKSDVGLGNVENTALSTWAGSTNLTTIGAATATSLTTPTIIITADSDTTPGANGTLQNDGTSIYFTTGGVRKIMAIQPDATPLAVIPQQLRKWRYALARQQLGLAKATIAFLGDSTDAGAYAQSAVDLWTNNRQYSQANLVAGELSDRGYDVNISNFFGDSLSAAGLTALVYDPRLALTSGWSISSAAGSVSLGGNTFVNNANANRLSFTPAAPFDTIDVWYISSPGLGGLNIAVDGGAKIGATVNTATAASVVKVTRTTALGLHTIDLFKDVAGDGLYINIVGINAYDSAAPKIDCFNWGVSGWRSNDWASVTAAYSPRSVLALVPADLYVINLTINDAFFGTSVATYKTNLQAIITACLLNGSVILVVGNPSGNSPTQANQPAINQACLELAVLNDLMIVDNYGRFVSYASANGIGFMTDATHPNRVGYQDLAKSRARLIDP